MISPLLAAAGPSPLWYLTRGTGLVALILLTASVALGVLNTSRWARPSWPRFATAGLHRNVSLLVVVVLAIHIITAELDTFAPVGWAAVVVPFASSYRPIWLGLGTLAFDLIVALVVTSLLRGRLGYRTWRAVHWAAYVSWPVAVLHGLGTGTDARLAWVQLIAVACTLAVGVAVAWRLAKGWPSRPGPRLAGGAVTVLAVAAAVGWAVTGPLRPGWAKRAGTPSTLLASSRPLTSTEATTSGTGSAPAPSSPGAGAVPAPPFSAVLAGTLAQTGPSPSGQVTITITARVSGAMTGTLDIVLRGQSAGGGVSLDASSVSFGTTAAPSQYRGRVVELNGEQLVASVTARFAPALQLAISLQIDPSSGSLRGTLQGQGAGSGGQGTGDSR
ncbi:MAG TPA: ferric reductase-like transmembrane domain-containing protein [Acidimicrobiales bacterium]|jgi:hypothetical protein|nr:ferric reductase-like transmembrane domain-containing protein [Acidimicrobiales bacterium]